MGPWREILLVMSDASLRAAVATRLGHRGHAVDQAATYDLATQALAENVYDLILSDVRIGGGGVLKLLSEIGAQNSTALVLICTDLEDIQEAVQAIKRGAFGIVRKPLNIEELDNSIDHALEVKSLQNETQDLRGARNLYYRTEYVVGESPAMKKVFELLARVAKTDSSVIIAGETGTGKELLAGTIHYSSARARRAFVKVNCAALPDHLLESELFGHERGAFTGADRLRIGRFELADGGSIFLDEIGDMSPSTQAKVLRVLQEKEFERLGANRTIKVDVRVISATNRDLQAMVDDQVFREDLYFRLNVVTIKVPPLRDRGEDIELLANFFFRRLNADLKKHLVGINPAAVALLKAHDWPGNVRELQNVIERAIILADGAEITPAEIELIPPPGEVTVVPAGVRVDAGDSLRLEDVEHRAILTALERSGWVQSEAARLLGVSKRVINYKITKYGITHPKWHTNAGAPEPAE